ncbi:MAG: heparinase II/III family protein, partial [Bacteroidia bacterium]|nr:heparinase II/III family protein [Bacteroidia bacterium]
MKNKSIIILLFISCCLVPRMDAQIIPSDKVLETNELQNILKEEIKNQINETGVLTSVQLAEYFKSRFSERFFYDHNNVDNRISRYNELYGNQDRHKSRAEDHLGKYLADTPWKLPFNYQNGKEVNAYALRHLARQHKMVDIILHYFNDGRDGKYIEYFTGQMHSLNDAYEKGAYEKIEDGNGVYEVFRSGYRILNWLWIHNLLLNEKAYDHEDQLYTIATLLQHGQHLFERNDKFRPGNHQTRGMSALAMLSILLRDFKGTDLWLDRSMQRLSEHLEKEVNKDGFQFERSVHYHMSDIKNYFYVYQLAKKSDIEIDSSWENKLRMLFSTLVKIAYPDKSAPVLQDDTEIPWADKNDISGTMTLGYLLFEDPVFGYFANDKVDSGIYWFVDEQQLTTLEAPDKKKPVYGSLSFPETHYYIMREGWNKDDNMMIISAGLDTQKPDHQHGDMLGIQAMSNGQVILPNYQVRYSLQDLELFKNSLVKNVALVDDVLQGKEWTSNKGGSGFGKFKNLPNPEVLLWNPGNELDVFEGTHDGFQDIDVQYQR